MAAPKYQVRQRVTHTPSASGLTGVVEEVTKGRGQFGSNTYRVRWDGGAVWTDVLESNLAPADCDCGYPHTGHIGGKPCVVSPPSTAKTIFDLPIAAWAWKEDGRDLRA